MDITFLIIFLSFLPNLNIYYFFNNHKYSKKKDDKFRNIFKRFTQYKNQLYKLKYSYKNNSSIFSVNINNKKCEDLNYKNIACTIFILEQNMKDNYRHINIILNNNKFNNLIKNNLLKADNYDNLEMLQKLSRILKLSVIFNVSFYLKFFFFFKKIPSKIVISYKNINQILSSFMEFINRKNEVISHYLNSFELKINIDFIKLLCNLEKNSIWFDIAPYKINLSILYFFKFVNFILLNRFK